MASRTCKGNTQEELRRPLRAALTEPALAGLSRAEVHRLVAAELRTLRKGAR